MYINLSRRLSLIVIPSKVIENLLDNSIDNNDDESFVLYLRELQKRRENEEE